jgi:hypothetical protein
MPRPRLHKSSIVVGLIVALLLVLIEIPGRVVGGSGIMSGSKVFEHGWPWVFLGRETPDQTPQATITYDDRKQLWLHYRPVIYSFSPRYGLPRWGIPWLSAENWRVWEADTATSPPRWDFNPTMLAYDVPIALFVLGGAVVGWEFWRRRRATLFSFRFGLRGLLLAIAGVGAALGWLTHLEREHRRETALIDSVDERSGPMEATWYDMDPVCVAPLWLRSLVGVRLWPEYFWRASTVNIESERGDKTDLMCAEIAQLDYVTKISLDGHPRHHFRFSALSNLPQLHTLEIWTHPIIEEQDVNELARLNQLKKIVIEHMDQIAPDVLARLKVSMPNCKIIDDLDDW